ncbi:MAG: hypothetical protein AAF798_17605 [Bacteroidota bacterium]
MNEIQKQKLEQIIADGYEFKFGDYIGKGFNLMQANMGNFIGFILIFFIISVVANFIPIIGGLANSLVISPCLMAGFYIVAHKVDQGQATQFSDFFKGFDYWGQLALSVLIISLITIGAMIPFLVTVGTSGFITYFIEIQSDPFTTPPAFPFWTLIFILPLVYLVVAYTWTTMFIVFYKMEAWAAMEMSRRMVTKQWFIIFLFGFVIALIAGAGAIALFVGLLFTAPAMLCAQYAAFADVTKLMEEAESDIVDHLVD